jgi:hypothetical protein
LGLSYALGKSARSDRAIRDSDLLAALSAVARSYETLTTSGLHYAESIANPSHQAIAAEIQKMAKQYREAEQKHMGYTKLRDQDVLRALVFVLRMGMVRTSGRPKSRAFIDFLFRQFPEQESAVVPADEGSRLIVP